MPPRPIHVLELRSVRGTGGGPEKTILRGAARTDKDRFTITVCYIRDERDDIFALDQLAASLEVDYVEIRERHSFDRSIWPALRRLIQDRHVDIVHSHEYKTDLLALLLGRAERTIPLATVHGWTGHTGRERLLYYPIDRFILARFPRIIAVSDQIRGQLIASGTAPERVSTVLNGIDPTMFQYDPSRRGPARASLNLPDDATVVGAIGRLEPQKRFDLLIDACAELRSKIPRLRLVIAGDGSLRSQLADQIRRLDLTAMCSLAGHRTDVSDVLHALDLFVQSSDYEGTSNALLEAMAVETPVVATTAGGTAEMLHDQLHGLLLPPGNLPALVEAIERALADRPATTARAKAARRRIEGELSFDTRMRTVEHIYEELMASRTTGIRLSTAAS